MVNEIEQMINGCVNNMKSFMNGIIPSPPPRATPPPASRYVTNNVSDGANSPQYTGIKFNDMGAKNVRLSPVVQNINPTVNGIKFNSD